MLGVRGMPPISDHRRVRLGPRGQAVGICQWLAVGRLAYLGNGVGAGLPNLFSAVFRSGRSALLRLSRRLAIVANRCTAVLSTPRHDSMGASVFDPRACRSRRQLADGLGF